MLLRKLGRIFGRGRFRAELDEEMAFHRAQLERELVAGGMRADEARRRSGVQFGNAARMREESQEVIGFRAETVMQDVRFALRQLRKNPGFAATAVVILALGIASSVAIFAFVDAALIKPLPYEKPGRLVQLFESIPLGPRFHLSYPDYLDWKRENRTFSALNVFGPWGFMMKTPDGLRQTDGARVSDGFFRTLGVKPVLGRDFYYGEDRPEAAPTTLITYAAWQKRYGGSPGVLGQVVVLNNEPYTIIGVLPRDFSFAPAEPAEFWAVLKPSTCRGCHGLFGVARLKDGVTFEQAYADVKGIAERLAKKYPDSNRDQAAYMLPLIDVIVGDMNGDGKTDIVISLAAKNSAGAQPRIATLISQPNGTLRWLSAVSVATLPSTSTYLERIQSHVLDLNLDGKLDFFIPTTQSVTTPPTQVIAVLAGNGTGNLSTAQRQPAMGSLQYVMSIPLTVGAPASVLFAGSTGTHLWVLKNLSH
jgi:hypothetical protein